MYSLNLTDFGLCQGYLWKIGNEACDDENNNAECGYDGGDCCGPNVFTDYCIECLCLEDGSTTSLSPIAITTTTDFPYTECAKICTKMWSPLCGTDGFTYSNECELEIATCMDKTIELAYKGSCGDKSSSPSSYQSPSPSPISSDCAKICTKMWSPLCGTDGVTYSNECGLEIATCMDETIKLAYKGSCKDPQPSLEQNNTCQTESGPDPNSECQFPFEFHGEIYNNCTYDFFQTETNPWCSTKVDEYGVHIGGQGYWGYCPQTCGTVSYNTLSSKLIFFSFFKCTAFETKQSAQSFFLNILIILFPVSKY